MITEETSTKQFQQVIDFVQKEFGTTDFIPLHEPRFIGKEKEYVIDAIDSTFVSSVGAYVNRFEEMMTELTGAKYAVATVNGTAALHIALVLAGVESGQEVITQALTFVATGNAIAYTGAIPAFVDVDRDTLGMSPEALRSFLEEQCERTADGIKNKTTGRTIKVVVPMHTFGFPCRIDEIRQICDEYNLVVVEDSTESLGSRYKNQSTGTFGLLGTFSFNGNKTVTSGAGGAIVTDNEELAKLAKHITTTAKVPHKWEYFHDHIGYNYRMANLNAAFACAQLEQVEAFVQNKRELAAKYTSFFDNSPIEHITDPAHCHSNYWLNAILLKDRAERDQFLDETNSAGVMTRPIWTLLHKLPMFENAVVGDLTVSQEMEDRLVNIPSSVRVPL